MTDPIYDIAIIGGGINGCGIARDAAGRGLRVYLCERDDLAIGTSSRATKLIHGGLRYLEHYEFRLVREALLERETLWRLAPHIIWPLRFILPYHKGLRPAWMLRLGLFLYDHLGGRKLLPPTRIVDFAADESGRPLRSGFQRGFEYSDCWVDDARLVVLNALDARQRGAQIETRTALREARRGGEAADFWELTVARPGQSESSVIRAHCLVNAAGPWVGEVLGHRIAAAGAPHLRMVQGSHIVVRRLFDHDRCYIFQNADGRIVFAIPYERDFTLIGTTDRDYEGDPSAVAATGEEIDYLCAVANAHFDKEIGRSDVVWAYSGVRPLYDDGASSAQAATRDYVLALDGKPGQAPLLNIFGGKITTYRRLAEAALDKLAPFLKPREGRAKGWTAAQALPGGDFAVDGIAGEIANLRARYPFLGGDFAHRLIRLYGRRAALILGEAAKLGDLGRHFGADLYAAEVDYLMREEWAETAEDILWRRSKLGLRMTAEQKAALEAWITLHGPGKAGTVTATARLGSAI